MLCGRQGSSALNANCAVASGLAAADGHGLEAAPGLRRRALLLRAMSTLVLVGPSIRAVSAELSSSSGSMAGAELKQAELRASVCSAANVAGAGLRGEYFADDSPRGTPSLVRVDSTVDFDRTLDWPASAAVPRPRSAQWTGWIKAPISGRYRFRTSQPRTSLVVARQSMIGKDGREEEAIELTAGRFYTVTLQADRLDLMQGRLALEWTAPFGARYVVPRPLLYVPNGA
jgi:hypothetical protein